MKKGLLNAVMALCIGLFAACSQEEIINPSNGGVETVSINAQLPNLTQARGLPTTDANHQLRCILEVWDKAENGKLITRIEKLASEATDGKLQFAFTVPTATNYQCLLWADFIATDAGTSATADENTRYTDKYFHTANLKAIDFKVADATLFNNPSSDAFCGVVDKNGTTTQLSVTLKRPFTKVILTDRSEYIDDCTSLGVAYNTPSGYNMATGIAATTKAVNATGLTPIGKTWFSTFIFASADKQKLDQDIKMTVNKAGGTETKTIKKGQISLDNNVENNAEANFSDDDDVNIDVDINGDMDDPNALKIGQFVNKDGTVVDTYNAENAIGIVYAAAKGKDDQSNYGVDFTDKTIAGYAMALTSITRSYLGADKEDKNPLPVLTKSGDAPWAENDYNGYSYSNSFLTTFGDHSSSAIGGYKTWVENHSLEATNLSTWYIPSATQLKHITSMLFGYKEGSAAVDETVKNNSLRTAYNTVVESNKDAILDLGSTGACWIMSSYCTLNKEIAIPASIITNRENDKISSVSTVIPTWAANSRVAIRPVLTIFKK